MSSLELSDDFDSSDDEDNIIAKMEKKSGLPQKRSGLSTESANNTMVKSETSVATVTMSGGVMKSGGNFYDSSESEDENSMQDRETQQPSFNYDSSPLNSYSSTINCDPTSTSGYSSAINSTSNISTNLVPNSAMNGKHSSDTTFSDTAEPRNKAVINHDSVIDSENDLSKNFKESRFNPFDHDLHVDEDHFEEKPKSHQILSEKINRIKSESITSSNQTDDSHPVSDNSDEITFADLGLSDDHFSQPEGYFGLSSTEELEMAIETCKEIILVAHKGSDKQKNLVKTLIQLRLKLQELKEGPIPVDEGVKVVVGHKFTLRTGAGSKHYCEKCNAVIWGMVQQWYRCKDCGYSTHAKCLNLITRTCAIVKVQEDPTYCLSICPERGLSSQNYRCAECRAQISYKSGFCEPRMCDYSGNYYCELCHWNDTMLIPARVLHNWDFDEWKVCRASKQFLKLMEFKAVIRIQDVNPMLFSFVDELNEVKKLREELLIMKKYILICAMAMNDKLLLQLKSRQHFVEGSDIYSMRDLIDVQKDALLPELAYVHSSWAQHIKTDCELCRAKGFICELCDQNEILFPFDNIAVVCSECSYVLHRHCFAQRGGTCPRCERRNKRKNN